MDLQQSSLLPPRTSGKGYSLVRVFYDSINNRVETVYGLDNPPILEKSKKLIADIIAEYNERNNFFIEFVETPYYREWNDRTPSLIVGGKLGNRLDPPKLHIFIKLLYNIETVLRIETMKRDNAKTVIAVE